MWLLIQTAYCFTKKKKYFFFSIPFCKSVHRLEDFLCWSRKDMPDNKNSVYEAHPDSSLEMFALKRTLKIIPN